MSIREDLRENAAWLKSEWEAFNYLRHGCFCGEGTDLEEGRTPPWIDNLDEYCKQHDDAYEAAGQSRATMFTADGIIATIKADRDLARDAAGAEILTTDPKSHPDPEGFRQRLIMLFDARAWFGEQLVVARDAGEHLGDTSREIWDWVNEAIDAATDMANDAAGATGAALENFKEWLRWAVPSITNAEPTPDDVRSGFEEHVSYLASVGVAPDQVDAAVREVGVAPEQLEADGLALSAVA